MQVSGLTRMVRPGTRRDQRNKTTEKALMLKSSNGLTADRLVPVWLAIGVVFGLFVSVGAGILAWLNGAKIPAAILTAGGAFVATITVVILVIGLFPG